jgi:hypothetical protein
MESDTGESSSIAYEKNIRGQIETYGMTKLSLKAGPIYVRLKCPRAVADVGERRDAIGSFCSTKDQHTWTNLLSESIVVCRPYGN